MAHNYFQQTHTKINLMHDCRSAFVTTKLDNINKSISNNHLLKIMRTPDQIRNELLLSCTKFQNVLIKILQDKQNVPIIEWVDGEVVIRNPRRLENEILTKYFRQSRFDSFKKQLNNFGFVKQGQARGDRYAPCIYSNSNTSSEVLSIMHLKSKSSIRTKNLKKNAPNRNQSNHAKLDKSKGELEKQQSKQSIPDICARANKKIILFDSARCDDSGCRCCSTVDQY